VGGVAGAETIPDDGEGLTVARAPPADDSDPDIIEFGIPVLDDRIEEAELTFPATRQEIDSAVGGREIPFDASGHTLQVTAALSELDMNQFETRNELLEALHPVFEGYRQRTPTGFFATLRSYLPF
jgi:hypothetical protein